MNWTPEAPGVTAVPRLVTNAFQVDVWELVHRGMELHGRMKISGER